MPSATIRTIDRDPTRRLITLTLADGKTIRWRNAAQWARNTLREEGLIRDAGRKWLKAQTGGK